MAIYTYRRGVVRFYPSKRGPRMPEHVQLTKVSRGKLLRNLGLDLHFQLRCVRRALPPVVRVPLESRYTPPPNFSSSTQVPSTIHYSNSVSFIFMCSHSAKRQSRFVCFSCALLYQNAKRARRTIVYCPQRET